MTNNSSRILNQSQFFRCNLPSNTLGNPHLNQVSFLLFLDVIQNEVPGFHDGLVALVCSTLDEYQELVRFTPQRPEGVEAIRSARELQQGVGTYCQVILLLCMGKITQNERGSTLRAAAQKCA